MTSFHMISISLIFSGEHPCVHYFLWRLLLCALLLCSMINYDITMGHDVAWDATLRNDIARDTHCDVTMGDGIAVCTYHGKTMDNEPLLLCITTPNYDIAVSPVSFLKLYT